MAYKEIKALKNRRRDFALAKREEVMYNISNLISVTHERYGNIMTALELVNKLCEKDALTAEGTADTFKTGDPYVEVSKVALCFIATPDVIKEAAAWGAELIITHEPTFYHHWDEMPPYEIAKKKRELIESLGVTLFRYHDHPHVSFPGRDLFSEGFVEAMGWKGVYEDALNFVLDEAMTPREMVRQMEEKLDVHHLRVAGDVDTPTRRVALLLGARGGEWNTFINSPEEGVGIGGEVCEWAICEAARDAAQFGIQKTVIVMGHAASERDGMKYITDMVKEKFALAGIEFRYFESGETFTTL